MRTRTVTWAWTLVLVGLASTRVLPQVDEGRILIDVVVPKSDTVSMREDTRRLYSEANELRLDVSVVNPSNSGILVDQATTQGACQITLSSDGAEIPVDVTWSEDALLNSAETNTRILVNRNERLTVEAQQGVYWTVTLRRVDGLPFHSGRYRLTWKSKRLADAIRAADGSPWKGRTPDMARSVGLLIQTPQNVTEEARMNSVEGDAAAARGDYQQAMEAYQRALRAEPSNGRTKQMLAFMYLRMNRYRDAIQPLEEVLAGRVGERDLSAVLALAYVGAGDEGNAVRVLRTTASLPEERVAEEMDAIRREVTQRRGGRR